MSWKAHGLHSGDWLAEYSGAVEDSALTEGCCERLLSRGALGGASIHYLWKALKSNWQPLCRDLLVDFLGDPYPPAVQAAFRSGRLGLMPDADLAQELRVQPGMLPNALIQSGPTLTAAAWQAQVSAPASCDVTCP